MPPSVEGIDLRDAAQLGLVGELAQFYPELPFGERAVEPLRYHLDNQFFGFGDGIMLYAMLRHLRPKRYIEVGCGFSSALTLDVNELFFESAIRCSFIEPHTERLDRILTRTDRESVDIIGQPLQAVDPRLFDHLGAGGILFIDSTHVSKVGSDVNLLIFEALPRLKPGVFIHFHDVFYPFEYPKKWIYEGRAWNEAYLLRAFLTMNPHFRIELFNSYLDTFHRREVRTLFPLWEKNPDCSIWLRRLL